MLNAAASAAVVISAGPIGGRGIRGGAVPTVITRRRKRAPSFTEDDGMRRAYAAHGSELYRFALRSLGDQGAAEDVVQETFVKAWRARER